MKAYKKGTHSSRWTERDIERAFEIANDIAEDIDNKETRKELRKALSVAMDLMYDEREKALNQRSQMLDVIVANTDWNRSSRCEMDQ